MVNGVFTSNIHAAMIAPEALTDPELRLACAYVPSERRAAFVTLWALDATLGGILRGGRDPMIRQIRLTWWHTALVALDGAPPPPQPLLQALAARLLPLGVAGADLAAMVEGWEELLDPDPLDAVALGRYASARGAALFRLLARVLGVADDRLAAEVAGAGQGWALVDLAWHASDPALRRAARAQAEPLLAGALRRPWPRASRPIGMLTHLARADLGAMHRGTAKATGSPARVIRIAWHALSGR